MAMTDEAMVSLCDAMREQYGAGVEFELTLGELIGRYRRAYDQRQRDAEAAKLLPTHGADAVAERQHCHRVTAYRRARRAIVASRSPLATGS
jgi:hypothetical protein